MAQIGRQREAASNRSGTGWVSFFCHGQIDKACSLWGRLFVWRQNMSFGNSGVIAKTFKGGRPILKKHTPTGPLSGDSAALKSLIESALDADKAIDIETIDLHDQTSLADYMIIASGRSSLQIVSTARKLAERLKAHGLEDVHVEGATQGDWVIVDAGDVIVHLFRPEIRVFYDLERMWRPHPQPRLASVRVGNAARASLPT